MYIDNFGKFSHCIVALFEKQTTQVAKYGIFTNILQES